MGAIPDKLFYRIGEVSRIAGVQTSVLRFWESEFPRIKPRRTDSGQRIYSRKDLDLILTIKELLYKKKFTIKGARQYLNSKSTPPPKGHNQEVLEEIRSELEEIHDLLKTT